MKDDDFYNIPVQYESISRATEKLHFNMASDLYTGSLLRTLVASRPDAKILELGTGSGLATSWIIDGMDRGSRLITVDNNELLIAIAREHLIDERIEFVFTDAYRWITSFRGEAFDMIFADAMPGKYDLFEETLALLKPGGIYVIDDMLPQPNWPEGHAAKADLFISAIEKRKDIILTKLNWSTGIIIIVKKALKNDN
jgi:predicted O-methyltransferase YrrM